MNAAICTLFEGDYHHGLAALANSLFTHKFRGVIWAGYRGEIPEWAFPIVERNGYAQFNVGEACEMRFVRVVTEAHLTNYKPQFMLHIWECLHTDAEALFYFDPDIVVCGRWSFFEEWVLCGVALCEDINSPMTDTDPIRCAWRRFGASRNVRLDRRTQSYVNGGFLGVTKASVQFVRIWKHMLELIKTEIGNASNFNWHNKDRTYLFYRNDQDALNMALESSTLPLSIIGREGMAFSGGGHVMYHALGGAKPWRKMFVWEALHGWPPSGADKAFISHAAAPISLYTNGKLRRKRRALQIASGIGRFVRKAS